MILFTIVYLLIAVVEWSYLKTYTRKPKTKRIVFCFIILSYVYNAAAHFTREMLPSPDAVLTELLGPIQKLLLRL